MNETQAEKVIELLTTIAQLVSMQLGATLLCGFAILFFVILAWTFNKN